MFLKIKKPYMVSVAILLLVAASGCFSTRSSEKGLDGKTTYIDQASSEEKAQLRQNLVQEIKEGLSRYRLSAGDVLEVMYHISYKAQTEEYRIGVSDELNIEFFHQPEINRTVVVRPDGKLTLPIKGDIAAVGLTPMELAARIRKTFSDILNEPLITVNVNKCSSRITELQKAITNAPRGQAKTFPLSPDGYIYLPLLKSVKAAGKTVDELEDELNASYQKEFDNLRVSVLVDSLVGNRVFIFGEVQRPGSVALYRPMSVLEALAMSGGVLPTGSLDKIKVLYWSERNEPMVRTVNLSNVMGSLRLEEDFAVPNNSVIYVPATAIAKLDRIVDQYVKQLLLFQGSSLGFSYELHSEQKYNDNTKTSTQTQSN
jgi:polysaccharide biosynthesis/export protein PslD